MTSISRVSAREILDSRGNPTVEVDVALDGGALGRAAVPSGASTGAREALEMRDRDPARYGGMGVTAAIHNVHHEIAPAVVGLSAIEQERIDRLLVDLDGTPDRSRLGANAILGVSMAVAHASAAARGVPLYERLRGQAAPTLPAPMFNILNGGKHAENSTDVQEFMVVPAGLPSFREAVRAGSEVFHALKRLLGERGLGTTVGDEGGFALSEASNGQALDLVLRSIEAAGYSPGEQCYIAVDVAASELARDDGTYRLSRERRDVSSRDLIALYETWAADYPIVSIEDGLSEDDWTGWGELTATLGGRVQLVGDDIYVTRPELLRQGIDRGTSNAILVKLNQIGTVTETLEVMAMAAGAGWGVVVSHRSGETEDTTVADLSVATAAGQIKAGAPSRGERTAKYNRLLRIEEELGAKAVFAGRSAYESFLPGA